MAVELRTTRWHGERSQFASNEVSNCRLKACTWLLMIQLMDMIRYTCWHSCWDGGFQDGSMLFWWDRAAVLLAPCFCGLLVCRCYNHGHECSIEAYHEPNRRHQASSRASTETVSEQHAASAHLNEILYNLLLCICHTFVIAVWCLSLSVPVSGVHLL